MEREIQLDLNFQLKYGRNKLNSMENLKTYLDSLLYSSYWYQGYAFRGKQLIMRLRQTMAWFSDIDCPYSNNNLPGNAVRFTCLHPSSFPKELKDLKDELEIRYGQKFNSLLIEKFDCKDSQNTQPFVTSSFCKGKESWVESNTKICVIPVGSAAPEKCLWMTKVLTESENKKDPTKKTKKNKFVAKKKLKFKNRIYAFEIENEKEWKIQMPFKKSNSSTPFYLLSFRCLDETKTLSHLRNYYTLQPLMTEEQLHECIVRKTLLTKEFKDSYADLARNYIYTQKTHTKKRVKSKKVKNNEDTNETIKEATSENMDSLKDSEGTKEEKVTCHIIPSFQVSKKRKIDDFKKEPAPMLKLNELRDEDMVVFEFLNM